MEETSPENVPGSDASVTSNNEVNSNWYFSRQELETNSPSRRDGIDLTQETRLRRSYCAFLKHMGHKLKFPTTTIATAIVLCQRFFSRQSHAKNDRLTIATACMSLAGKVEDTNGDLKPIICSFYEFLNNKKLRKKEVYKQLIQLITNGEKLVLATLNFEIFVQHPCEPLKEAITTYMVNNANPDFPPVAWRFALCCLVTSLCLQYEPHHIAAGVFLVAAEQLKMDLVSIREFLFQEFDVTPRQLEDIHGQILEVFDEKHTAASVCDGKEVVHQLFSYNLVFIDGISSSGIERDFSRMSLNQSDGRSDHKRFKSEGSEKDNSVSEVGETNDDSALMILVNASLKTDQ